MAARSGSKLLVFVLLICSLSLQSSCSRGRSKEEDYNCWVSRNVQRYIDKTISEAESLYATAPVPGGGPVLDERLRKAEKNKVRISVSQDGSGDFKTIREALGSIPTPNSKRIILSIKPGVYREKITIPRSLPFLTLSGNGTDPPVITGNDTASVTGSDGTPLGTLRSATVAVEADYFMAINIKFEARTECHRRPHVLKVTALNGLPSQRIFWFAQGHHLLDENTAPHEIGSIGGQAVALRISGTKAAFHNCSFYGAQDTLYDHKGLHYFSNCFIQGSVDFIFGYGRSLYENCYLNSIAKKVASLTAQKRSKSSLESGFSFKDSVITGSGQVFLGRAWGDYSRVVFSYSFLDKIVLPQGWSDWGSRNRDLTVYYGEYKCSGPGANLTGRVPWARRLTDEEAKPFIGTHYIEGDTWLICP